MGEGESIQLLRVFVAYASDVVEEQKAVFRAAEQANELARGMIGYRYDQRHWKQEPPGTGRPQDKYNRLVDECDLFIGIVGHSWGEPPRGGGEFTSGFHEEFDIARKRYKDTGEPEILLYLKEIPQEKRDDPGQKLATNMAFRKKVKESGELAYRVFKEKGGFESQVVRDLFEYLKRRQITSTKAVTKEEASHSAPQPKGVAEREQPSDMPVDQESQAARSDLLTISNRLTETIGDQNTDIDRSPSMPVTVSDVSRVMLLLNCWMSQYHTGELLGSHQINLLYRNRQGMRLLVREREFVLRNLFGNKYAPGWYWLRDDQDSQILDAIVRIATEDRNDDSRLQAVRWLTDAKMGHDNVPNWDTKMLLSPLSDSSSYVRAQALRYLTVVASEEDLEAVRGELRNEQLITAEAAFDAELLLRLRFDVKAAFEMGMRDPDKVSSRGADALAKHIDTIDEDILTAIAASGGKYFSVVAAEELARRGSLSASWIQDHLVDSHLDTRSVYCLFLIRKGAIKTLDELKAWKEKWLRDEHTKNYPGLGGFFQRVTDRALESALLSEYTYTNLKAEVTWLSEHGPAAYAVLCERFWSKCEDHVREDLTDGFESLKNDWISGVKNDIRDGLVKDISLKLKTPPDKIPEEALTAIDQALKKQMADFGQAQHNVEDFISSNFIKAALDGISGHDCTEDVEFLRKYLDHPSADVRLAAVNGLKRLGVKEDLKSLLTLVNDEDSRVRHLAAETAIHLAPGIDGAAVKLFDSTDPLIPGTGIKALLDADLKPAADLVRPLLGHSEYAVRRDAFIFFQRRYNDEQLEQLLDDYISSGGYHYDVVCWLDRHLYGPAFFQNIGT